MPDSTSYLNTISFNHKLKKTLIAKYILNPRLVIVLVLTIIGIGLYSFLNLPRTLNPEIKIPIVLVSTVLPGASPKDVESLITIPIEDAIGNVSNVKKVTSSSQDSVSVIQVEFNSGVDPDKAQSDVKSAVDTVNTLPVAAKTPTVIKVDFAKAPVWIFSLTTKNDNGSLMRYAQVLQDKIKQLKSISEVDVSGLDSNEFQIVVKPEVFATYGLNPLQLSQIIGNAIKAFPAGSVKTDKSTFALTLDQDVLSVDDLRNLTLTINNTVVPLSQIAVISERPKPDENPSYLATKTSRAKNVVTFNVFKSSSVNIDKAYNDTKKLIDNETPVINHQFTVYNVINTAGNITRQFGELGKDFAITISLVFIVLLVFLGIRQAVIASLAIPLTFFVSFIVMYISGITLSFISLFSLLLALGLLVDDTIVVVSAITSYYRTGKFTSSEAGLLVWRDFITAIFTTTITTVWAFLPLLLSTGIIGEFIKPIPIVVSSTLMASFLVAMLVTLPVVIFLLEPVVPNRVKLLLKLTLILLGIFIILLFLPKTNLFFIELFSLAIFIFIFYQVREEVIQKLRSLWSVFSKQLHFPENMYRRVNDGLIHFSTISNKYHFIIERILSSKRNRLIAISIAIIFSLFAYILVPLGFVNNEFFPKSDQDTFFMTLELPAGTNVSVASNYAKKISNDLRNSKDIDFITADVGQSFNTTGGVNSAGSNDILFTFVLPPKASRHLTSLDIGQMLRDKYKNYSDGKVSVVESTGGPPAGSDLQIKLFGNDLTILNAYADKLQEYLRTVPGVINIDKSIKAGTSKLVFVPDKQKMASNGITQDQVAMWLRLFASGITVDSVKFDPGQTQKKDITIRMNANTQSPEALNNISIPNGLGRNEKGIVQFIPLTSLGTTRLETNPTLITRESGKRTISVTAGVTKGYSVTKLNSQLEHYADSLNLPNGYSWQTGGVNQQNQESVQSILAAMVLSFLLIIMTMVLQFGSFRRALIVMLVIPLSISGVFIIFALTNTPLSFPALIGVLALFGIVVKNSILIVDKIIQNQNAGLSFIPAIADASSSRLEAIALTSVATIIGLIPISLSDPLWRGLGGAIIAGLTFSGTIMLFFIPVVYYYWFQPKKIVKTKVVK